jgi:phosphatidylserine/phosphatidylglycerophosphate/cardiolipin synthase-like enzyme
MLIRIVASLGFFIAGLTPSCADRPPIIRYAPAQNLERIDVALIDEAKSEIDFAAYILTDWPVMQALNRAANRGVRVRIYLDNGRGFAAREPSPRFLALASNPAIDIRVKRAGAPLMHLKSYQIDGRLLRTGAANFTASGLKQQDNDLIVIENQAAAEEFRRHFEKIYMKSEGWTRPRRPRRFDDTTSRRKTSQSPSIDHWGAFWLAELGAFRSGSWSLVDTHP